eukprot:TRINITY_DN19663_c0_g1::TRINITY_DN19663_c0_g1_i1::g.3235::m.3235 TRINITY_DN19663_c0_g1::TRINITY_DN19663_c0_g1_i1::g.3235  ORF type:complete len:391 (+),score=78.61,sp/Q9S9P8/FNRR2_ARATH/60.63/1e-138,NAD_binding_1/PF00175.16/2.7e-23,FAD_binding_6/PF00970.19/0.00039,FAD_binding_1/PF00667.15/4,FAD_binding_1/PF00667.15/2.3,YL1_C/PF08265.6/20,YL1_C/PF08265.6/26 TRINITY_DN19663_c0_g1_i1:49-1173(+)
MCSVSVGFVGVTSPFGSFSVDISSVHKAFSNRAPSKSPFLQPNGRRLLASPGSPHPAEVQYASTGEKVTLAPTHLENGKVPMNTWRNEKPYKGKILSIEKIVGPKAPGEIYHIVIDHRGEMPYWEGQSFGVLPPGTDPKNGKPYGVRLYSIASSRYGDHFDGRTASFCIRRAVYVDPKTGKEDPSKKGVCSNYICDLKPGDEVSLAGPTGKVLLMQEECTKPQIMIATGTGIAPFRSFVRRLFLENVPRSVTEQCPLAWLFMGVPNKDGLLYQEEFDHMQRRNASRFRIDYAISREGPKNKHGGKMYVQDKVEEHADELWNLMEKGAHFYFCGLKGMIPGITKMFARVAKERGESWDNKLKMLKKNKQWHVEVY